MGYGHGLWAIGYRLWAIAYGPMGYGLWAMGYELWVSPHPLMLVEGGDYCDATLGPHQKYDAATVKPLAPTKHVTADCQATSGRGNMQKLAICCFVLARTGLTICGNVYVCMGLGHPCSHRLSSHFWWRQNAGKYNRLFCLDEKWPDNPRHCICAHGSRPPTPPQTFRPLLAEAKRIKYHRLFVSTRSGPIMWGNGLTMWGTSSARMVDKKWPKPPKPP